MQGPFLLLGASTFLPIPGFIHRTNLNVSEAVEMQYMIATNGAEFAHNAAFLCSSETVEILLNVTRTLLVCITCS